MSRLPEKELKRRREEHKASIQDLLKECEADKKVERSIGETQEEMLTRMDAEREAHNKRVMTEIKNWNPNFSINDLIEPPY